MKAKLDAAFDSLVGKPNTPETREAFKQTIKAIIDAEILQQIINEKFIPQGAD